MYYNMVKYPLRFEKKDGMLSAVLSYEAMELMLQMEGCLPWGGNGKWGLLYFARGAREEAERMLQTMVKESPLLAQVVQTVAHRPEFEMSSFRLFLPPRAARFAQIKQNAVLRRATRNCMLLLAEE